MFARAPGAVAAPTAGLHLTPAIGERAAPRAASRSRPVTLHVGCGTFAPVRDDDLRAHACTASATRSPRRPPRSSHRAARSSRSAPRRCARSRPPPPRRRQLAAGAGATELFVHPGSGHAFRVVDHLITNFHLPESTLLMLVCAFAGTERVLAAYRHAVAARYRFFSYGDAMLLHRAAGYNPALHAALDLPTPGFSFELLATSATRAPASCTRRAATSRRRCSCRSARSAPSRR